MEELCPDLCLEANMDQLPFHSDTIWVCGRRYWLFREAVVFTGVLGEGIRNLKEGRSSHLLLFLLIATFIGEDPGIAPGISAEPCRGVEGMPAFIARE